MLEIIVAELLCRGAYDASIGKGLVKYSSNVQERLVLLLFHVQWNVMLWRCRTCVVSVLFPLKFHFLKIILLLV